MLITPSIDIKSLDRDFFQSLIVNGIEESIHLEYKSRIIKNEAIAKHFSAFANTDGGNIIFGINEVSHKPIEITSIKPQGIKEKLDQIATNGIDPLLNVKIWPVDINSEGQIFVVYIPKKYPILHFAAKKYRYYKRTNFTSTPMECYEIEQAFKLRQEISDKLNIILRDIERLFDHQIGSHFNVRFIVHPIHYGNELFKISSEMNEFFRNEIPKTPKYKSFLIWNPDLYEKVPFRQEDYFFESKKEEDLAACLIRKDGIIIYNLQFDFYNDQHKKNLLERYRILDNPLERIRRGVVFDKRIFPQEYVVDYFLGFLNFLYKFYMKMNYLGDINFTLKIRGLGAWVESTHGYPFRPSSSKPISNDFNVELIPKNKLKIVKKFFTPIFNGYGLLEDDLREFYEQFESLEKNLKTSN